MRTRLVLSTLPLALLLAIWWWYASPEDREVLISNGLEFKTVMKAGVELVYLPVWSLLAFPIVLSPLLTVAGWPSMQAEINRLRYDRGQRIGCTRCGYAAHGLRVCPECGNPRSGSGRGVTQARRPT